MRLTFCLSIVTTLILGPVGRGEFQVNVRTDQDQKNPAIAMASDGRFVVVWSSYQQDGSSNGIRARLGKEGKGYVVAVDWLLGRVTIAEAGRHAS